MGMEFRPFGKTGMNVSVLGFGTSEIGFRDVQPEEVERVLNTALDTGINVVDTAECYMDAEEKIGRTISHRRNEYYLFTKCGHCAGMEGEDWEPNMLRKQIDRSLERLKTDYVDLIQLHTCSLETLKQGEVIEVLQEAKAAGKTRFIGHSGDSKEARYAVELGIFDSLQTSVNFADQECIDLTLPLAKEKQMGVIAKRPVANVAWNLTDADSDRYGYKYTLRLRELAYEFEDMFETALRFTYAQDVSTMIVGTSNPSRFAHNMQVLAKGPLDSDQVEIIRKRWKEVAKEDWIGQT